MSSKLSALPKWAWLLLLAAAAVAAALVISRPRAEAPVSAGLREALPAAGNFARADGPRAFDFPADYGPHEDFQTEWWYYTGSLADEQGRRFGYQLTFFRRALAAPDELPARESEWAAGQVYLAHFTLSDIQNNRFQYWEETSRGAAGLAGAQADPLFSVWLYDWRVLQTGERTFSLSAAKEGMVLELDLEDAKGPVLHGQQGYSQKGEGQGNASYYISQTRLVTRGRLQMDGEVYQVSGTSWMDHEFSTSALSGQQVGWDWFSIQLDDGREVLVYTIRNADGSLDPHSYGSLILEDGSLLPLTSRDFSIEPTGEWTSPHSGAVYPSGWRVNIHGQEIELQITPLIQDQELVVSYTYWEGAVEIQGTWRGRPVTGRGYTELTGYAESMQGQF